MVVSLSKYHYGQSQIARRAELLNRVQATLKAKQPLDREVVESEVAELSEVVESEVAELREKMDYVNDLLEEISDLSVSVQETLCEMEYSIAVLEELE